ncbi:MAG: thiamine biosynthesis protein ThiF, partial [Actinomycetota bacterium]|nr:thiamine biosynthesis protein ThiF [Actinomycetota bacterium]
GALLDRLVTAGVAHLAVAVRETAGVVGPLVRPGITSCLRCADLHRGDRDPVWPALAAQLATAPPGATDAQDTALGTMITGLAGLQALSFLDGEPVQADNGTLELALPDCLVRRRSWPPHPDCGCRRRRLGLAS